MQKQNNSISQKIKDRIFYIALFTGVMAIFAVVAVYTMGQDGGRLAKQDTDTKGLSESEYAYEDEMDNEKLTEYSEEKETKDVIANTEKKKETIQDYRPVELDESILEKPLDSEMKVENNTGTDTELEQKDQNAEKNETTVMDTSNEGEDPVPVVAEAEALNFNSESTISWPVEGKVTIPFSMETTVYFKTLDQYRCNPGMLISAGMGSTVKNAYMGKVTKVTSDNDYGNMVTVYLGNDYSAVYGQLDTIYVKEGDYVKAGDSIGTIGKPTDTFADEGSHLFFQMLQGKEAVDPALYIE